jgi:hypothetical protein
MKILRPNHAYELENFDNPDRTGQVIRFIEKNEQGVVNDGTTNEEVLIMLIDRMRGLHQKVPSRQSALAITKLEEALMWLFNRTEERRARGVEGTMKQ